MREPLYRASSEELSPACDVGVRERARKRILPAIIQKEYADAKNAFDKQEFRQSPPPGSQTVLKSIADPDIASLRRRAAARGHPHARIELPRPQREVDTASAARRSSRSPCGRFAAVYGVDDRDVIAPVAMQQRVPKYPANVIRPLSGVLEFVVDENGAVQGPMMQVSIDPSLRPDGHCGGEEVDSISRPR